MQKDKNLNFDEFIKKRVKSEGLETPSMNFTNTIISNIEAQSVLSKEIYGKPLIPKYLWYSGAVMLLLLFSYLIYGNIDVSLSWIPEGKLQQIGQLNLLDKLPNFNVSSIYVYAFVGLAFFVGIQIYLLKSHFDKRFSLNA